MWMFFDPLVLLFVPGKLSPLMATALPFSSNGSMDNTCSSVRFWLECLKTWKEPQEQNTCQNVGSSLFTIYKPSLTVSDTAHRTCSAARNIIVWCWHEKHAFFRKVLFCWVDAPQEDAVDVYSTYHWCRAEDVLDGKVFDTFLRLWLCIFYILRAFIAMLE